MSIDSITIRIGGTAGAGISATTNIIARTLKDHGYIIQTFRDIPSRIRGGHTNETVRASTKHCFSNPDYIDILIALDELTIRRYLKEMRDKGVVIIDSSVVKTPRSTIIEEKDLIIYEIPATRLARQELGNDLYKNTIILGVLTNMLGLEQDTVKKVIRSAYASKKETIITANIKALKIGMEYFEQKVEKKDDYRLRKRKIDGEYILVTGNDAVALGAIVAGCRFISGYPITPATQILERLINYLPNYGGVGIQVEDEISAINAAIGAAIAGARAMTATSGPGLSLMSEAISLAGMAEVPVVIVNSNRAGPSTGMPTKTEQSDLLFTIFLGHGEFPKIVIAPATNEEAFYMTIDAFNFAEKCQCPVIILIDEFISHGYQTAKKFDLSKIVVDRGELYIGEELKDLVSDGYRRYKITESGVSPRTIPLKGGTTFITTGLEHDEFGYPTEDPKIRVRMMDKRLRKLHTLYPELIEKLGPITDGDENAEIGIITFGSVSYATKEAILELERKGIKAKILRLRLIWPFPEKEVEEFVRSVKKTFVVEMNATGQLYRLVRMVVGSKENLVSVRKYSGRMFKPMEIATKIMEGLG